MAWSTYTATFGAQRPGFQPPIEDPDTASEVIRRGVDWMLPVVTVRRDEYLVTLTMLAPSAEAAMHHMRGSLKSALHTAGLPQVGTWPLSVLRVEPIEPEDLDPAPVQVALPVG